MDRTHRVAHRLQRFAQPVQRHGDLVLPPGRRASTEVAIGQSDDVNTEQPQPALQDRIHRRQEIERRQQRSQRDDQTGETLGLQPFDARREQHVERAQTGIVERDRGLERSGRVRPPLGCARRGHIALDPGIDRGKLRGDRCKPCGQPQRPGQIGSIRDRAAQAGTLAVDAQSGGFSRSREGPDNRGLVRVRRQGCAGLPQTRQRIDDARAIDHCCLHQIEGVEIRIEDQAGRVANMRSGRQQRRDQFIVGCTQPGRRHRCAGLGQCHDKAIYFSERLS